MIRNRPLAAPVRPAAQGLSPGQVLARQYAAGGGTGGSITVPNLAVSPGVVAAVVAQNAAAASCALPASSKATQVGYLRPDGSTLQVTDPHFGSQAEHDAWIAAHPACAAPPAYVPDLVLPPTLFSAAQAALGQTWNGLSYGAWAGLGLAGAGVLGGLAYLLAQPAPRAAASRSTRRTSRRASRR